MKNVNYHPNEHERYADFIEEMLKHLKNKQYACITKLKEAFSKSE